MDPALSPGLDAPVSSLSPLPSPPPAFYRRLPWWRIGIVALAALLRLWQLDLRPPHFDEGVNGWFLDQMQVKGFYKYDPSNYHGPLHFYVLFVFKCLFGRNLWALRLPVAIIGAWTVDWLFRFERFFGRRACAWAALAMAVSPGFLYYQRDAIHETWLVFFLVMAFWGLFGLWQEGRRPYLWAAGMGLTGMILTKETYVIHVACLFAALPCAVFLERLLPSTRRLITVRDLQPVAPAPGRVARFTDEDTATTVSFDLHCAPQHWRWDDLAAVAAVGVALILFFYSGNGYNRDGIKGLVTAYAPWGKKASEGEGHNKPFLYWLRLVWRNEPLVFLGLLASLRYAVFPAVPDWRARLLAIYALGTMVAYSLIPYKTPWCVLAWAWPFFLLAGFAATDFQAWAGERRAPPGWAAWILMAGLLGFSTRKAVLLNFRHPTKKTEDYVYVQTANDVFEITGPLLDLARENPANYHLHGVILCDSTYPLPWMLGDFTDIGYYANDKKPPDYHADFLLVTQARVAEAEAGLDADYFKQTLELRAALEPQTLYLRASVFRHLMPEREPEFHPAAGGPVAEKL